jgi:hypothetical protein
MACSISGAAPHRIFHQVTAAARETTTTSAPPPSEVEASDFDWIGDLGRGGFTTVIKVRHRRTREVFTLKEAIRPTPDAYEEAEVLRRVPVPVRRALPRRDRRAQRRARERARVHGWRVPAGRPPLARQGPRVPQAGAGRGGRAVPHGARPSALPRLSRT